MMKKKILFVFLAALTLFSGCLLILPDEEEVNNFDPSVITLIEDVWTDSFIASLDKEQWFKFTASASLSCVHFKFDNLREDLYIQLYNSDGEKIGEREKLLWFDLWYDYVKCTSFPTFAGQEYYIKIESAAGYYSNNKSSTYKIKTAFNSSPAVPVGVILPSNAIRLNADTFADGYIPVSGAEQWFKFTATADKQYIHAKFGTLGELNVQLYKVYDNIYGFPFGEETELSNAVYKRKYTERTLNAGEEYYIKVSTNYYFKHDIGSYKIAFNTLFISPDFDIKTLTANVWTEGDFTKRDEVHWYKFTATAAEQYIHASFDTLDDWAGIRIQLYDTDGNAVGGEGELREDPFDPNGKYTSRTLEAGKVYYIKVYLYTYLQLGKYKITINPPAALPPVTPPSDAILLLPIYNWYYNYWFNTYLTAGKAQWFKFIAAYSYAQYIHINFNTLNSDDVCVQLLDINGKIISESAPLRGIKSYTMPLPVYPGQVYYIKVLSNTNSGAYKIAFSTFAIPPLFP